MLVVKQANGLYRWYAISSNNIKDRDGETVRLKALQGDVARTKMFGDDSHLRFYHVPYDIGGAPDYRVLVDGMLIETGEFYDHPVANAVATYCSDHPDGIDGSGWKMSIGFLGVPDLDASYHSAVIDERSVLPGSKAANSITQFGVREKMTLTADQQKALDVVLGDPTLVETVKMALSAQEQSKAANASGLVRKAAQTPQVPVLKAGQNIATPQQAAGFGTPVTKAADPGQAEEEATIAVAQANLEVAATALANAADAVGTLPAREEAEDAEEVTEGEMPEVKAADKPAETTPNPAPAEPSKPAGGNLSDEDAQAIAKYVQETVQKAVGEAMNQMKAEMQAVSGEMQKMARTFSVQTQAKMLNEVPRSTFERLKAFGATEAAGIAKTIPGFNAEGLPVQIPNPAYVEKGKNLPEAPADPVSNLMNYLGFTPQAQE